MTNADAALPPQAVPVTDDGGIAKIVLQPAPDGRRPEPRWEKGSNAKLHFAAYTFAPEGRPANSAGAAGSARDECRRHAADDGGGGGGGGGRCCALGRLLGPKAAGGPAAAEPAAKGERPPLGTKRKIRDTRDPEYEGATEPGKPFDLRIGRQFMMPALELAVRSMRVGERAKFLVMSEYTDGYIRLETLLRKEAKKARAIARGEPLSSIPPFRHSGCAAAMCAELAEPENWDLANLSSAPMELDIHLLELEEAGQFAKEIWEMSSGEKWAEARALKERGGCLYREGRVAEARDSYARALALLESLAMSPEVIDSQRDAKAESERAEKEERERRRRRRQKPTDAGGAGAGAASELGDREPEERAATPAPDAGWPQEGEKAGPTAVLKDGSELRFSDLELLTRQCRLNYAACCLRLDRSVGAKADLPHQGALQAAVEQCTKVLQDDPRCVKALFRRAQAYSRIGRDLDLAERDLADLVEKGRMNADDPEFVAENRVLRDKAKAARETEKTMFQGVFS